ncbi:MAG TPA: carbohydrate-binding protein [Tepidisphaeraceae bacterium]|nr:carbohydrate-binding protein [Tepidisphaeraceae bacterium]
MRRPELAPIEWLESRTLLSNTWYVATTGSNSNPGTVGAPFKTIQFAADQAKAGDSVDVFGGVYHETVTLHNSGTASAPIIFQPYENQNVTIDGADPITGWTASGASTYTAAMPENLGAGNNQIFVDNQMMTEARWPNVPLGVSDVTNANSTALVTRVVDKTNSATIYNPSLQQANGFWVGGSIDIGPGQDWVKQTGVITASGAGWVTFTYDELNTTYEQPRVGNNFYLFGVPGALDSAGEWFRALNGTLSLRTPADDSPTKHLVEAKARLYGFDVSQASHIQINGFNLFACAINTSAKSTDVVINHITDQYLSNFSVATNGWHPPTSGGIVLAGLNDVLENSTLAYSAGDGVDVTGKGDSVINNVIHDTDYSGFDCAPVQLAGMNDVVSSNTIYNAGRDGIFQSHGGGDTITHNLVHDYALLDTDTGGFYCFGLDGQGTVIADNEFYNGIAGGYGAAGIMFDNNSENFVVNHNITYNDNIALRINGTAFNLLIYNNTFDATEYTIATAVYTTPVGAPAGAPRQIDDWTGTRIIDNISIMPSERLGLNTVSSHNMSNNGKFVDAAARNYNLLPGAPAIGSGMALPPYTNGYSGKGPDVGALPYGVADFSFGASSSIVATPPPPPVLTPPVVMPPVVTPPVVTPPVVTPPKTTPPHSAKAAISGMNFNAKHGNETESLGGLGYNFAGNWVEYTNIDFGTGISKVTFEFAVANAWAGQQVILRLDSPTGTKIGTLTATGTGGWGIYAAETAAVKGATGVHNLYLCMGGKGPTGNIKSFVFA